MAPPALPRQQILDTLKSAFLAINGAPNWNYAVTTVQTGLEITRNFSMLDLPLVMIDPQMTDTEDRVTFGGSTANRHHRRWPIQITGIVRPADPLGDIRAEGEKFLSDLVKQLLNTTITLTNGQQVVLILRQLMGPDNFERSGPQ